MAELVGPSGHVFAVEPDPENFQYLQANLARQGATNVTAINCAISDSVGVAPFLAGETMFSGLAHTRSESVMRLPLGQVVEVKTKTLDSLAQQFAIPHYIKVDIENFEVEALREASNSLATMSSIACETNHFRQGRRTQTEVETAMGAVGDAVTTERSRGSYITRARVPRSR